MRRRAALGAALAGMAVPAAATDYTSPAEVLDAIDALEAEVEGRLAGLAAQVPAGGPLRRSILADHERHRRARARLRVRRGLAPSSARAADPVPGTLAALRDAQERLVYAHAEGVTPLDPEAVGVIAAHLVDLSRHLAVLDLWIDQEQPRG